MHKENYNQKAKVIGSTYVVAIILLEVWSLSISSHCIYTTT